ncbi:flippase [Halorarius halobius]|uniref:flippase n=1 Tax=Halorarius halobius TaxID=2962671 RepID=UPI0020CF4FAB|nr:flippase [Halorarius halobius]
MSLADRISRGLKANVVAEVLYSVSNAVLILVLTRYLLTAPAYGMLHYALSVLAIVAILGSLGLPKSAARFVTEYAETSPGQVRHLLRATVAVAVVLAGVVAAMLTVISGPLADLLEEPSLAPFLALGAGYVVTRAGYAYIVQVFQGFNRVDWSAVMKVVTGVGRLVVGVALVLLGFGAIGVLLGYIAGFVLAILLGGVVLYRRFYRQYEETTTPEEGLLRRVLRYSVPLTATRSAGVIDNRVDTILVGALLNPTAVAYYVLAKQISDFSVVPASSFGFTISPALGEQKASEQLGRAARLYEQSLGHVLLLYAPACVGLWLVARPLVRLVFGSTYLGAVPVLQVFCVFILVHAVNKTTSDGLDYLGRARSRAIAKMGMAGANFGLNLLLIPVFGVVGAAVATVVTYSAYTAVNVYYIHQELSLRLGGLARAAAASAGLSVVVAGVVVALMPYVSSMPTLLAVVALGGSTWAVLAVVSGAVDVEWVTSYLI